jgi:glutamine synthetase
MPGSAFSISDANVMINTAVAESLRVFADRLESSADKEAEVLGIIKDIVNKHRRILFNGNNYCDEWVAEAQKRGLLNLKTTVDAAPHYMDAKNVELFKVHGVFSETELHSRYEIMLESYTKTVRIEALCLSDMITKGIIPVILQYERDVAEGAHHKKSAFPNISVKCEEQVLSEVSELTDNLYDEVHVLENLSKEAKETEDLYERARIYCDKVRPCMDRCRIFCDKLERIVGKKYWPYPSYGELLFSI